jgi:hypothetical protein
MPTQLTHVSRDRYGVNASATTVWRGMSQVLDELLQQPNY